MARYIDADALMEMLNKKAQTDLEMGLFNHGTLTQSFIRFVERQPTADVAPRAEWISVDERLPESLQRVLAINTEGDMFTAVYISFVTGKNAWSTSYSCLGVVTHWMPLPEPPDMKGGE